jgi:hypothetical protein
MLPTPSSHVLKIEFNSLSSMPRSYKGSVSIRFSYQHPVCTLHLLHTCGVTHQSNSSWCDHLNKIWWLALIMKLLIMKPSSLLFNLIPLRPCWLSEHPSLEYPWPVFLPQCQRPSFTPV